MQRLFVNVCQREIPNDDRPNTGAMFCGEVVVNRGKYIKDLTNDCSSSEFLGCFRVTRKINSRDRP